MNQKKVCDAFAKLTERNKRGGKKIIFPLGIKRKSIEISEQDIGCQDNNMIKGKCKLFKIEKDLNVIKKNDVKFIVKKLDNSC